jgi:hypothetical protein
MYDIRTAGYNQSSKGRSPGLQNYRTYGDMNLVSAGVNHDKSIVGLQIRTSFEGDLLVSF